MTLLITGATGSIGSGLVERLADTRPLRLLVRPAHPLTGKERLARLLRGAALERLEAGEIEVVEADLSLAGLGLDSEERRRLGARLTGIVHAAARTDFQGTRLSDYRDVNVQGAVHMAELAAQANCPLILLSTAYVSGTHRGRFFEADQNLGQGHHNPYERSKLEAELAVLQVARRHRVPVAIFRPGVVLPDEPRPGIEVGPGPLVYLKLLAGLEGTRAAPERELRYPGDPDGVLNLVGLPFVLRILTEALDRPILDLRTYHLTASRPFCMEQIAAAMSRCLPGIRTVLRPPGELHEPDRYERLLARRCRTYEPYLSLRTVHDRARLLAEFDGRDGADPRWLDGVFDRHLRYWNGRRAPVPESCSHGRQVTDYFREFLPGMTGRLLVPGLRSLTADFTVSVLAQGSYRLRVACGVLESVRPQERRGGDFDFEVDGASLLEAVGGQVKPAELFFDRRIRIRGNLFEALSTATALEDFFELYPYRPSPAGTLAEVPR